jgi:hypothetical protein
LYNYIYRKLGSRRLSTVKFFFLLIISLALLGGGLVAASTVQAKEIHPQAETTTGVCVVYQVDEVFSGGIGVSWPEVVSYRHIGNGNAFLWLPNQERLKVQSLAITPLVPGETGCVGILVVP